MRSPRISSMSAKHRRGGKRNVLAKRHGPNQGLELALGRYFLQRRLKVRLNKVNGAVTVEIAIIHARSGRLR